MLNPTAKYQGRTEAGSLISSSDSFTGIDAFLDQFADGTPNADYETLAKRKDATGNTVYVVRAV